MTHVQRLDEKVMSVPTVSEWTGPAEDWDRFVMESPERTVCHLFAWKSVMEAAYGHKTIYLAAHDDSGIRGVLPLVLTRSPVFGANLTSLPFLDYGGILATDEQASHALMSRALELRLDHNARLTMRYGHESTADLPVTLDRVSMILSLSDNEEEQWSRLRTNRRSEVRQGQKNGLQASFHREDGLKDFYSVFGTNMRDLGSPVHGISFFRSILRELGEDAMIVIVRDGEKAVSVGFCLVYDDVISLPWASSVRKHFPRRPNQVLFWEIIKYGIANGFRSLDLGRSRVGDGTYQAKRMWGAEPTQLYWYSNSNKTGPSTEKTRQLSWVMRPWKYLPISVANTLGPWIRKGIPN